MGDLYSWSLFLFAVINAAVPGMAILVGLLYALAHFVEKTRNATREGSDLLSNQSVYNVMS